MGYPVPTSAPTFVVGAATYAVAMFVTVTPIGEMYMAGVFVRQSDGSWNSFNAPISYTNAGDLLADVVAKGGIVKYIVWLKGQLSALIQSTFSTPTLPTGEPTNDAEALALVQAAVSGWHVGPAGIL